MPEPVQGLLDDMLKSLKLGETKVPEPVKTPVTPQPVQGLLTGNTLNNVNLVVNGKTVTLSFDIDEKLGAKLAAIVPIINLVLKVV